VPVLAGVIGDVVVAALGASRHMPAESLGSTGLDRRHDLELGQADMPGIGPPPHGAVFTEDVSDLQLLTGHPPRGATPIRVEGSGLAASSGSRTG
jgi:hypothetical protein